MADTLDALFGRIHATHNRHDDKPSPVRLDKWTHLTLYRMLGRCGAKRGAELGVREGLGALAMCASMPGLHLLCIDPWDVWPGHKDMAKHADNPLAFLEEAKARLAGYDCEFVRARSSEAVRDVPDRSLDFIVLDGDHTFDGTLLDLILWAPKVKAGGVLCGHDYTIWRYNGVVAAVNAYAQAHVIREWYITGDRLPYWFWQAK